MRLRTSLSLPRRGRLLTSTFSRSHTLVNLVTLSDLPIVMPHVPELDYMSYISCVSLSLPQIHDDHDRGPDGLSLRRFEVYERMKGEQKELSVRVTLSEGAHSAVLDASLDAKHALQVQPRRALTGARCLSPLLLLYTPRARPDR